MRYAYAVLGVGIITVVSAFYLVSDTDVPQNETMNASENVLTLASPAFEHNGTIPAQYTCDGERTVNPPLTISNVPEGTRSLVLIMDDPDIPQQFKDERGIDSFDHWVVYGIPPETVSIGEGVVVGTLGLNGSGKEEYTGPCPPPEYEPTEHRYVFTVYALSGSLQFVQAPTKAEVKAALNGMVLGSATLLGKYDRAN